MKTEAKAAAFAAAVFGVAITAQAGGHAPNYLTFTAEEAGSTVKFGWSKCDNLEFNTNGAWETYGKNAQVTLANVGDKVQFRAKNIVTGNQPAQHCRMTGKLAASGSVTSLIDQNGGDPQVVLPEKCFYYMFNGCTNLTVAPELPALNLTNSCYSCMFVGTWLTKTPKLPATKLAKNCYANMFASCKYLVNPAPMDHVTSLAEQCCFQMYMQCWDMKVYTDSTHEGFIKPWKATSATEGAQDWSTDMFPPTDGGLQGAPTVGETYFVSGVPIVTVTIPEVAGAKAELFVFDSDGGWASVATDEVPSNAMVRVVWTADADKVLTGEGAANVYQWQKAFVADKAVQDAPAPTVGTAGESEVSIGLDTRTDKTYFTAAEILPVWYADGAEVKVKGEGEQMWKTLVKSSATTNTLAWKPTAQDVYTLTHPEVSAATVTLTLPVEVTTNSLEVAKTSVAVTDNGGQPLVAQTEAPFAGQLIVPSNSTIRVAYTVTESGLYFVDGSTTYVATFTADKSVNDAATAIAAQKPSVPAAPNVKVGVAAQRYPWNGMIDVRYKVSNTPAGAYKLKVMADCGGVVFSATVENIKSGIGTAVIQSRGMKEMTSKNCRIYATLQKQN